MKRTHQLTKFKTEIVEEFKRLRTQTGAAILDDLIARMIRLTDAHRAGLKDLGLGPDSTG